jgi:hypothetical protein
MNMNHKEYISLMKQLLLCFLLGCSQIYAMHSENNSGNTPSMELCETTLFKRLMESAWKNRIEDVRALLNKHDLVRAAAATSWGTNPLGWQHIMAI